MQVIVNFLTNANRYSEPGSPVTLELQREDGEDGYVRVAVRDEGSGIPAEALPHIFRAILSCPYE